MKAFSPAFQTYPADFLSDLNVAAMSCREVGAYILLLYHCWLEDGLPDNPRRLAKVCRMTPAEFDRAWNNALKFCFEQAEDGTWRSPRLDREKAKQQEWSQTKAESGKLGAQKRWNKPESPDTGDSAMAQPSSENGTAMAQPSLENGTAMAQPSKKMALQSLSSSSCTPSLKNREGADAQAREDQLSAPISQSSTSELPSPKPQSPIKPSAVAAPKKKKEPEALLSIPAIRNAQQPPTLEERLDALQVEFPTIDVRLVWRKYQAFCAERSLATTFEGLRKWCRTEHPQIIVNPEPGTRNPEHPTGQTQFTRNPEPEPEPAPVSEPSPPLYQVEAEGARVFDKLAREEQEHLVTAEIQKLLADPDPRKRQNYERWNRGNRELLIEFATERVYRSLAALPEPTARSA